MRWRFNQSERSEGSKCQRKTGQESSVPAANFVFSDSEQKVSSSFSLFHPLPAWLDNINIHGIWIYSLHIAVHYLGIFPHMDVVFYLGVLYFLVLRQYLMGLFINWLYIGSRGENIDRRYIVQSIIVLSSQYREVWSPQYWVSTILRIQFKLNTALLSHCPCVRVSVCSCVRVFVCPSVTGVTSQLFSIIWWFRAWKPCIFWKHVILAISIHEPNPLGPSKPTPWPPGTL